METLFDLHDFSQKRICANAKCGKELFPKQKIFCCPKCKRVFFQHKEAARIKARFEFIQNNQVPLPEHLSEADKEAVRLYLDEKRKYGIRAIAHWQGRSHSQVRRVLIDAGVYRPTPEQNRRARKGTGPYSRVRKQEISEERKKEWERKVQVCLDNLKQEVKVETTCHTHGWTPSGVWHHMRRKKTYKEWKASHPAKTESVRNYQSSKNYQWRSKKYPSERVFQDAIELFLKESKVVFVREKKCIHSRSRVDFEIGGSIYFECKICTKATSFSEAIGQAIQYKTLDQREVWVVVPDDVVVRKDQLETLEKNGILVLNETDFRLKLSGKEILSRLLTKTTVAHNLCKCCGKSDATMSRSPSGSVRSYCVNCEDQIKQRIFDQHLNRWIPRPTVENIMPGL